MGAKPSGAPCTYCGAPVQGNFREMIGWEAKRGSKQGGLHGLTQGRETGRYACDECGRKLKDGVSPAQTVLPL